MVLNLQYIGTSPLSRDAVFIRGSQPSDWFAEINRWRIPLSQLECYILPVSLKSTEPSGLFVINRATDKIIKSEISNPYMLIGRKLYIPANATLIPEITHEELDKLLLWDLQIFHPTIGLVGFEKKQQVDLIDLIEVKTPLNTSWDRAHRGIPERPGLQSVSMPPPSAKEVMESIKEKIETKPLSEIPMKEEDKALLSKIKDLSEELQLSIYKGILSAIEKLPTHSSSSPTLPDKLWKWAASNMEQIEKSRNKEINRLLNLFDENSDEALKYAIPLDSQYMGRGKSAPSGLLGKRDTNFSLKGIGGGDSTDYWDIGDAYAPLRSKYMKAAEKAIKEGDFNKAAYIHAHLLGDFHSAANVLQQGKYYREAAALYKDHLKNPQGAAECLEKGGYYLEAIEVYKELKQYEKTGDLYNTTGNRIQCENYYETAIESYIKNDDYLNATRVIQDKLKQEARAQEQLLEGWQNSKQSEPCLKRYFHNTGKEEISNQIQKVYKQYTPFQKTNAFLNIIADLVKNNKNPEAMDTSRNIAYEIISEQVKFGNHSNIAQLKTFLPDDRLIAADCSRYSNTQYRRFNPKSNFQIFPGKGIKYITAISHRNQFLALGIQNCKLHLIRSNWDGHHEYYTWPNQVTENDRFSLIANPFHSIVVLHSHTSQEKFEEQSLPKNKYFDELLTIRNYNLPDVAGLEITSDSEITALKITPFNMTLQHFALLGELKNTVNCSFNNEDTQFLMTQDNKPCKLIFKEDTFYTFKGIFFMKISKSGSVHRLKQNQLVIGMAISHYSRNLLLAILTLDSCFLISEDSLQTLKFDPASLELNSPFVDLTFISKDYLVVAEKDCGHLFEITDGKLNFLESIKAESPIVGLITTYMKNQFAFLHENGRICVYNAEK